ncbi:MAG: protein kinase [Archangium sp.]|nr:protein kinase [Archangium sp.]
MSVVTTNSGEVEDSTTAEVAADALDPLVGQVIDGRWRVVDIIGKGAMGKVYRAVQLPLNRAVAIKVLDSTYGAGRDESFKQRFLVEAALTAKLNHPNTVRVVDYGSTKDGLFFLAMEYLDGETLEKVLMKGALPWHRVLNIGQQIARALREAHELGVVHRDLKPANVVMLHADADDTDFVKVLDFGLVKSFVDGHELEGRAITQQGMLMGSPPYMAPEQGEKNRADPRSDIYSLGTMLFEMLTGKPPYNGGGALEVILKHVNEPIPPIVTPSKFEAAPEAFKAVVVRALAKSPMDRFQSMEELLLAMQDVAPPPARAQTQDVPVTEAAVPVVAPPPEAPAVEEPVVLAQPPRSPSTLLIGGFFVAAVAGVLGTWMVVKPSGAPTKLTFHLETSPSGANVFVDGKLMGVTPIDLEQGLANGRAGLELRLEKEGFVTSTTKLSANGGRLDFSQTLTPKLDSAPAPVMPVDVKKPEPRVEPAKPPEPKVEKPEPKLEKPEPKSEKQEPKKQPEPANEIDKAFEAKPVKPPVVNTVKNEPKSSKKSKDSAPSKNDAPRPASKLDEDDAPAPSPTELKRPTP